MSLVSGILPPGNNGIYKTRTEIELEEVIKNFTSSESNAGERVDSEEEWNGRRPQLIEIEDESKSKGSKASSIADESDGDEAMSQDIIQKELNTF